MSGPVSSYIRCVAATALVSLASPDARAQGLYAPSIQQAAQAEHERELGCMAQAIIYEAGLEPLAGQQAVAQVILNRTRSGVYPKTVCGVVYQGSTRRTGCQFTFTCDGSLAKRMPDRITLAARAVAEDALQGRLPDRVGVATHYHASYVSPYWAPSLMRVGRIGAHIFYSSGALNRAPGASYASNAGIPVRMTPAPSADTRPFSPWGLSLVPNVGESSLN